MRINILMIAAILAAGISSMIFAEDRTAPALKNRLVIKYGLDSNGFQNYPSTSTGIITNLGTSSAGVDLGSSILMEFQHPLSEMLSIGVGATYNLNRNISGTSAQFSFLPVYATASLFPFGNVPGIAPYAKVDLGYNVAYTGNDQYKWNSPFQTALTGGMYWGIGAGARILNTIFADIMFTSYSGTYQVTLGPLSTQAAVLYTKVSLNAGIGFDL